MCECANPLLCKVKASRIGYSMANQAVNLIDLSQYTTIFMCRCLKL
jgi:hypothetical protein